ncbi:MAG: hypothetical protein WKG52_11820 [Variovorax sp.]
MPTSIPYDPSLTLGNIVEADALDNLLAISTLLAPVDMAQETMNSFISMKQSIDMTIDELTGMEINATELVAKREEINKSVSKAAADYATIRIEQETKIQPLRARMRTVSKSLESPIDYVRTRTKSMPLSADSLKMDAQYFSFDENEQQASNTISTIKKFVTAATSGSAGPLSAIFGGASGSLSSSMGSSAVSQINQQRQMHNIAGTLIITASCTHRDALLLAPFILDVDKAIHVWNRMFPSDKDKIVVSNRSVIEQIAAEEGTSRELSFNILSGATFGSSFVGMVHVLRDEQTLTDQKMESVANSLQTAAQAGNWFSSASGGFGLDSTFANDIKNMLSTSSITSHVSLLTMGFIPTIKSTAVAQGVKEFADFSPDKMMEKLAALANFTQSEKSTVGESAAAARAGGQLVAMQKSTVTSVLSGLADIEKTSNQMLDVNSMMLAFDDYVLRAGAAKGGSFGVPINYYLKPITRSQLAQMWMSKYYPNKYMAISGDDSPRPGAPAAGAGGAASADAPSDSGSAGESGDSSSN